MRIELTKEELRRIGSVLAGVLDGAVDEVAEWVAPTVAAIIADRVIEAERETLRRYALREISWDGEHPDGHTRDENGMADLCGFDVHAYKDEAWRCWRPVGHSGMHIGGRGIQGHADV